MRPLMCQPKEYGGLGIQNLDIQNKCLLSKWLFKLCNEEGVWQELLRNKYLKDKTLGQVNKKPGDSYFWTSLMGVKDKFLSLGRFSLKDGSQIRFWEDIWLGNRTLKSQFPSLFNIVRRRHATVAEVFSTTPLNISFRRALVGDKLHDWLRIVDMLLNINLQEGRDTFIWSLQANGCFTVHSMYKNLVNNGIKVTQEI